MDPRDIETAVLETEKARITVLSIGCAIQAWEVKSRPHRSVVLGYGNPADYIANPVAMGIVIGRVANRISGGRFTLDGQTHTLPRNAGPDHIHGGPGGFGWRNWRMERDGSRAVRLTLTSEDGDQGYPGKAEASVTMTLDGAALRYDMKVTVDRPSPVNLAQHSYFNLMGDGDVMDHVLQLRASNYTPNGPDLIPLGKVAPVDGTIYDFRKPRRLGLADPDREGSDANVVLDPGEGPAATLTAPDGLRLRLWTDQPGLQVYSSVTLGPHGTPMPGPRHLPFAALCLEAQGYPDALNKGFPASIATPDAPYTQTTTIEIA
ncbi:hypothetical protein ATO11_11325 [Pseudaestuariivita atlantica]|uniref:Aldose 1-epimerase n=1 Tax=Pseudaestuariivita atlantica TaxID=1317121 RepID=A0A0L1JRC9_9RHOB|nr:hypothetical protein ATO11_11325 [Pseudaestuariivita atlantica]